MRQITLEELLNELEAQEVPRMHFAVRCPACNTIQSPMSFILHGVSLDDYAKYIGFSCIGRFTGAGPVKSLSTSPPQYGLGCNWSLGGFLKIHELEIIADDGVHPHFEVATKEQAQALMKLLRENHNEKNN